MRLITRDLGADVQYGHGKNEVNRDGANGRIGRGGISKMTRICLTPRVHGVGGMVSFRHKMEAGLKKRGIETTMDLEGGKYDAVLVIGGTRNLAGLWKARRRGVRVVQRLNGMNWLHKRLKTGMRHYLRASYGNWALATIRRRLADGIVYQSEFSKAWWEREYGRTRVSNTVVYNAVDLQAYSPEGAHTRPGDVQRILLVEGSLQGGYEMGLKTAVELAEKLQGEGGMKVELMVVGRVSEQVQAEWGERSRTPIQWAGEVGRERIPEFDRSAHLLYSADINAACPNSVIEAMACGLPVLAFDTGALAELVDGGAGRVVPYGGDAWRLDAPDVGALVKGAVEILGNQKGFREGARERAEARFGLDEMVEGYLDALLS